MVSIADLKTDNTVSVATYASPEQIEVALLVSIATYKNNREIIELSES